MAFSIETYELTTPDTLTVTYSRGTNIVATISLSSVDNQFSTTSGITAFAAIANASQWIPDSSEPQQLAGIVDTNSISIENCASITFQTESDTKGGVVTALITIFVQADASVATPKVIREGETGNVAGKVFFP